MSITARVTAGFSAPQEDPLPEPHEVDDDDDVFASDAEPSTPVDKTPRGALGSTGREDGAKTKSVRTARLSLDALYSFLSLQQRTYACQQYMNNAWGSGQ